MRILIIIALMGLLSCDDICSNGEKYRVIYEVVYPDKAVRYDKIIEGRPILLSHRGTNTLYRGCSKYGHEVEETTAPIRIITYAKL